MHTNLSMKQVTLLVALLGCCSCYLASGQQVSLIPQSNLGRIVQTLAQPLVMASQAAAGYTDEDSPPPAPSGASDDSSGFMSGNSQFETAGGFPSAGRGFAEQQYNHDQTESSYNRPPAQHHQHNNQPLQLEASRHLAAGRQVPAMLQQSPSYQRGVPQRYRPTQATNYNHNRNSYNNNNQDDDEADSPPTRGSYGRAAAPSEKQDQREYQMGAYLGPSMDDKEINNAFNSNDEGGASDQDGETSSAAGGAHDQAASNYNNYGPSGGYDDSRFQGAPAQANGYGLAPSAASYWPSSSATGAQSPSGYGEANNNSDEDGADEDDGGSPMAPRRGANRNGALNQAATQHKNYRQQQQQQYNQQQYYNPQMAANGGNSPYGNYLAAGPVDLSGMMSGLGANQIYQGDGGYPGQNYYNQQAPMTARNQAASSIYGGYGPGYDQSGRQAGQDGEQTPVSRNLKAKNADHDPDMDGDDD